MAKLADCKSKDAIVILKPTVPGKEDKVEKQFKPSKCTEGSSNPRKSVVTMYNHTTRDSRDIPFSEERLVIRNSQDTDDAYSQAMKESSTSQIKDQDHLKKVQEVRSKVAMTKQNVEKEYRDTISFLNALPKDKGERPIVSCSKINLMPYSLICAFPLFSHFLG